MSDSHEKLPKLFWIQIALVIIVGVMFLLAPSAKKHISAETTEVSSQAQTAAENLKPVGQTAIVSNIASDAKNARSGEKAYNGICGTCHNTGIANAPKIDDKAAWEPRIVNGLTGLFNTATNGKGAMPPRGGDPAITDEELKATILYMTQKAGFDLSSTNQKSTAAPSGTKTEDTPNVTTARVTQTETEDTSSSAIDNTSASAPVATITTAPAAPKAPAAPTPPVINSIAKVGIPSSITTPTSIEPPKAPEAIVAKLIKVSEIKVKEEVTTANKPINLEEGKKVYKSSCFACHDTGVAGAPKLTDKAAWAPRIATGNEALYVSALSGKGVMPPKGGNMGLADAAVKAAVDYMAATAQ